VAACGHHLVTGLEAGSDDDAVAVGTGHLDRPRAHRAAAGLKPGDEVVAAGGHVLSDGQKVVRFAAN
jgi:hypothetical protein